MELLNSSIVEVDEPEKLTFTVAPELMVNPLLVIRFAPELTVMLLLPVILIVLTVMLEVTVGARVVLPGITMSSVLPGVPEGDQLLLELKVVLELPVHV